MMRTTSTKLSFKTAVGLLMAGGLLVTGLGWEGVVQIKPVSLPMESIGPMMPLLPLTAIHLLNLLP